MNALYFATHALDRPRGWNSSIPVGRYCRAALVLFFNYGVDTGTVWKSAGYHEPILWRHVSWGRQSPDRDMKEQSPWGWLYYRRVKTGKAFYRPMNRVVHAHLQSLMPENPAPQTPGFSVEDLGRMKDFENSAVWRTSSRRRTSRPGKKSRGF